MKTLLFTLALLVSATAAHAGYYDQFLFSVRGSCADMRGMEFHQSAAWFGADLGRDEHGRPVHADMALQLFANGRYWLSYQEVAIDHTFPNGGSTGTIVFSKALEGAWTIQGRSLVVPGLLTANPTVIHDHGGTAPGYAAVFTSAIHGLLLRGQSVMFGAVTSGIGPKGLSAHDFCHQ
jgi:hypothetical protein